MLKVKLCPAEIVRGRVSPLIAKPVPVRVAWETVTLESPELVKVAVCVLLLPTCTLPKLTELAARVPGVTPDPERGIVKVGTGPLFVMARFTLLLPSDWGANATVKEVLFPAASVMGKLSPVTVYPAPAATCDKVMAAPPELVNVSGKV